ncbi:MAG: ATP-binding protein, partial [Bdellovibrionales bacterium]
MLDNGYSLARVELLNWGNFHGYQKFSLHESGDGGPLFQPPPATAILGVNGSGKSTLIDALMIVLLPFEGSLKLGVTNDVEAGSGGGRTIKDYVLGKHSSQSGVVSDPGTIFGRKQGCSFILLNFVHNRNPERTLTLGRAWWYQNYRVSETQLAFLSYQKLTVADLCPEGRTPATPKLFRQNAKESGHIQLFETMQSYFTAASQALGRLSRDDLKILNRAFFVKSISNIDQFIRENMLVEQESPNLDRLMDNVRNGKEIALTIERCEAKIQLIARILRELNRLAEFIEAMRKAEGRKRLLSLHREWSDWRDLLRQRETLGREMDTLSSRMPLAKADAASATEEWKTAHSRLLSDDTEMRLSAIDQERRALEEKINWQRRTLENWEGRASDVGLKLPAKPKPWAEFIAGATDRMESLRAEAEDRARGIEELRERRYAVEASAREAREELEHITRSGTLIPRELHAIKENAALALKIPIGRLMFVGELLQVRRECRDLKIAVESVLFPISRNLLCHPDHLHELTRWLDKQGLRADVTVKRIHTDELQGVPSPDPDALNEDSVLRALEIRSAQDHPFTGYLWRWLVESFDYEVVDVKRFKSEEGKLVTPAGLVKKDRRTMRKLKQAFSFSLGWDNAEAIERLGVELVRLQNERSALIAEIETKVKSQAGVE